MPYGRLSLIEIGKFLDNLDEDRDVVVFMALLLFAMDQLKHSQPDGWQKKLAQLRSLHRTMFTKRDHAVCSSAFHRLARIRSLNP